MRRYIAVLFILGTAPASLWAEDWVALTTDQITQALSGTTLDYEAAFQTFNPSGTTLYNAGQDSWGNWHATGDKYCSQWPPRAMWDCYGLEQAGDRFRFVDAYGNHTVGVRRPQ